VSSGLVLLTQNHIVHLVNVFIRAGTSRSAAALTSVQSVCVSELLEQHVNATFRPSFVRKFLPQLSRIISL